MRSTRFLFAATLSLVAGVASPVLAQTAAPAPAPAPGANRTLPLTTIVQSGIGGPQNAAQLVIQTSADYANFFGGNPPASPAVDFSAEDVLAVAMGTEPTGGYSISITAVELAPSGAATVHVQSTTPGPNKIVNQMVTTPFHVVKLAKAARSYAFSQNFDTLALQVRDGMGGHIGTIRLDPAGNAHLEQSSPTAKFAPIDSTATGAELAAVNAAFANADVATLPALVPDNRMTLVPVTKIELVSTISGKGYTFDASIDYYGGVTPRVKPLVDALKAISDRLTNGAAAPSFDQITMGYHGGFIAYTSDYTIEKDGTFTVRRTPVSSTGGIQLWTDRATAAELAQVQQAFAGADVTTLPATIQRTHFVPDIGSLDLKSSVGGQSYETLVQQSNDYNTYDARLRPLVDAMNAIADRVVTLNQGQTITGLMTYDWNTGGLTIGANSIDPKDPLFDVLSNEDGYTVTLMGTIDPTTQLVSVQSVQATVDRTLNVRKSGSAHAKILGKLHSTDTVTIVAANKAGTWYEIDYNGSQGWVYANYVTIGH